MYQRYMEKRLQESLSDTPVVFLGGARQTGKSTLVKNRVDPGSYFNLDVASTLSAAQADPVSFIRSTAGLMVIDEIQRAPKLFLAIKATVDEDRRPGRFLLTGSANVMLLPQLSDSLAGRMEILQLWPLSQGEIRGCWETFIDRCFSSVPIAPGTRFENRDPDFQFVLEGGYPEVLSRRIERRRQAWYESYLTAILQRDIRDLSNIEGLSQLPRLLSLLAARVGCLLNWAEISRSSGIAHTTLLRYITLLETVFFVQLIPAWSGNLSKRMVKAPKLHLCDVGLVSHLCGITQQRLKQEPDLMGPLLENFVVMELKKQSGWSETAVRFFHYRTQTGKEVDLIMERADGACVGVEVKASASVSGKDFKGLIDFAQTLGDRFICGVVLYRGDQVLAFGTNLYAVPLDALWNAAIDVG